MRPYCVDVLGYRRLFLLRRSLTEPLPPVQPKVPLTMKWLTREAFTDYQALRPAVRHSAWIAYQERELPLVAGEVYLYEAYTIRGFAAKASRRR